MSATATKAPEQETEAPGRLGAKTRIAIAVVLLAVLGGALYWLFFKPSGSTPPPEPGEIVAVDSIQINLADGHYLRLGFALQLTTAATHGGDGSRALDAAIDLFSGKTVEQLAGSGRERLKERLTEEVAQRYHGEVMDVYFTEFVTQ